MSSIYSQSAVVDRQRIIDKLRVESGRLRVALESLRQTIDDESVEWSGEGTKAWARSVIVEALAPTKEAGR